MNAAEDMVSTEKWSCKSRLSETHLRADRETYKRHVWFNSQMKLLREMILGAAICAVVLVVFAAVILGLCKE